MFFISGDKISVGAAQKNVGLNSDLEQFLDAVLCGFRLEFARRGNPWNQSEMDEETVFATDFLPHLPDGFQKWQRLDVADRSADFDDRDVDVFGNAMNRSLDLVGHMRNNLDGLPQIIAPPFLLNDGFVDAAGGEVVAARQFGVGVPLVVSEIEIGFSAVVGDVDFAVLIWTHGAGIDIQVGIELEHGHREAAAFEKTSDRRCRQPLAQRRNNSAGHENKFLIHLSFSLGSMFGSYSPRLP